MIDTGRHRVLVDTGSGPLLPDAGNLFRCLRGERMDVRDIDVVILSHTHPDHMRRKPERARCAAFPNARYVMLRAEWEYWMSDRPIAAPPSDEAREARMRAAARTNLSAVQAQLDLVDPEIEILEGISTVPAFGHTPGHMALDIASNGERLLFAGDAIIDPIDVEHPESVSVFDHQLEYVMATRLRLLDKAAREKALVSTSHCPFPGLAYVTREDARWHWQPMAI